jgi:hypothetical protein
MLTERAILGLALLVACSLGCAACGPVGSTRALDATAPVSSAATAGAPSTGAPSTGNIAIMPNPGPNNTYGDNVDQLGSQGSGDGILLH